MPDASTQTEQGLQPTRKPIAESTTKKYDQAIKRITEAGFDLTDTEGVLTWIKTKGAGSAQKVYLSALKYELGKRPAPFFFPPEYQKEIDLLYGKQNEKEKDQELSEKQATNFVPFDELLRVQTKLDEKADKTDREWKNYIIASLYTLQPPVRADYGEMGVFARRDAKRTGNELIMLKKEAFFVFRVYKTQKTYGNVEVRVSPALRLAIEKWFAHLGRVPPYLLGRIITPNDLLGEIQTAFRSTKRDIGINLLRHAYITQFLSVPRTIREKETLASQMLHSTDRQTKYHVATEIIGARGGT